VPAQQPLGDDILSPSSGTETERKYFTIELDADGPDYAGQIETIQGYCGDDYTIKVIEPPIDFEVQTAICLIELQYQQHLTIVPEIILTTEKRQVNKIENNVEK